MVTCPHNKPTRNQTVSLMSDSARSLPRSSTCSGKRASNSHKTDCYTFKKTT
jgi:hypothetical protein